MKYNPGIVASFYVNTMRLPMPVFEYRFHPTRKWRMDMAWTVEKVAVEVQGGIFIQGRHSRGAAMVKEWEKLNTLACMGWRVLYCQPKDVCMVDFANTIHRALYGWKSTSTNTFTGAQRSTRTRSARRYRSLWKQH